jgi:hypothetical protein
VEEFNEAGKSPFYDDKSLYFSNSTSALVSNIPNATAIGAGEHSVCALLGTGNVARRRGVPTEVSGLGEGATAAAGGLSLGCALLSGEGVECWGKNIWGDLGARIETNRTHLTPVPVESIE